VSLDAVLVSLRDPDDPMAAHELHCFERFTGLPLRVVQATAGALGEAELEADLLLFGGSGAYSVLDPHDWVRKMLDFLVVVAERGVPAWGSCFGYQGLALALGGRVVRDDGLARLGAYEVDRSAAAAEDPVFGVLPERFRTQFGHHDHVVELPSGVSLLAESPSPLAEGPPRFEAFRVDGSRFWAAQFHPELTSELTLSRFEHYKDHYDHDAYDQVVERIAGWKDTGEVQRLLPAMVELAREVKTRRKG